MVEESTARHGLVRILGQLIADFELSVIHVGSGSGLREIDPFEGFPVEFGHVYRFEADIDVLNVETEAGVATIPVALSNSDGNRVLHVCRHTGASSFFEPNLNLVRRWFYGANRLAPLHDVVEKRDVNTRSLDSLMADGTVSEVDFLRMNIQGGELEALRGGSRAMAEAVGIQIELSFDQTYIDAPLFSDIEPLLREAGFVFFDFLAPNQVSYSDKMQEGTSAERYWRFPSAHVFESHCLFLKDFRRTPTADMTKCLKLAAVAEMYGQLTFARDMLLVVGEDRFYADTADAALRDFDNRWGVALA